MNSSPNDVRCPDRQILAAFILNRLPPETQRSTESHVSTCPECSAAIRELSDESEPHTAAARSTLSFMRAGGPAVAPALNGMYVPDRIGQYEVLGRIGWGGMGVVCRARHLHLKKLVAIKILPPTRLAEPRTVARFEREMEVVGKLDHPNIVRATDAGFTDGIHYLAMELIDGVDLAKLMRACGPLPVADACELIRQAAAGLQHAHENGLVHRDIKPGNLMLSSKGEVKVLDLGLALLGDPAAEALSASGQFMGTPDYMSPEQFESTRVDIRSDVYSLGCTLFALLNGSPPFQSRGGHGTVYQQMRAHREQAVPPLDSTRGDVPAGLVDVLHRMLQKEATDRQQTPAELAAALSPFCAGSDLSALAAATVDFLPANEAPPRDAETRTQQPATVLDPDLDPTPSRKRLFLAVGIVLLTGAVVTALAINRSRPNEANAPAVELPSREFKPGEWVEILDREPEVVHWPNDPGRSRWIREADNSLSVTCGEWGVLSFADVVAERYDLEITMSQTPWTGGVGVLVRGRPGQPKGQISRIGDLVMLDHIVIQNAKETAKLFHAELRQFVAPPHQMIFDISTPSEPIPRPLGESHRLMVMVGATGVESVSWDGAPAPNIVQAAAAADKRAGAHGKAGVWCQHSTTRFTSVRIRVHPPKGDRP